MYNIAVCDDDDILCNQFERALESYTTERKIDLDVFCSGEELIQQLSYGQKYDLIFLDIELCIMNGVEVGTYIRNYMGDENMQIVYISAKQQYAMELFETRPFNFLIKPISNDTIMKTIDKAMELAGINNMCFNLKKGFEIIRIPYGNIYYFESDGRKIKVHTDSMVYDMYEKMNNIEPMLPEFFIRVHQSYIVNVSKIKRWKATEVCITESTIIPVSRNHRKKVSDYLLRVEQGDE